MGRNTCYHTARVHDLFHRESDHNLTSHLRDTIFPAVKQLAGSVYHYTPVVYMINGTTIGRAVWKSGPFQCDLPVARKGPEAKEDYRGRMWRYPPPPPGGRGGH